MRTIILLLATLICACDEGTNYVAAKEPAPMGQPVILEDMLTCEDAVASIVDACTIELVDDPTTVETDAECDLDCRVALGECVADVEPTTTKYCAHGDDACMDEWRAVRDAWRAATTPECLTGEEECECDA